MKSIFLFLARIKESMILLLKVKNLRTKDFSMDSMHKEFSRSWLMVFLKKVFILFKVEKDLSASLVVIPIVTSISIRLVTSRYVVLRLCLKIKSSRPINPQWQYECISVRYAYKTVLTPFEAGNYLSLDSSHQLYLQFV